MNKFETSELLKGLKIEFQYLSAEIAAAYANVSEEIAKMEIAEAINAVRNKK